MMKSRILIESVNLSADASRGMSGGGGTEERKDGEERVVNHKTSSHSQMNAEGTRT